MFSGVFDSSEYVSFTCEKTCVGDVDPELFYLYRRTLSKTCKTINTLCQLVVHMGNSYIPTSVHEKIPLVDRLRTYM